MRERAGRVDIWRQLTFEASTFGHGALVPPARKGIGTDENGSPEFAGLREQGAIGEIGQPEDDFDRHWQDFRPGENFTWNPARPSKRSEEHTSELQSLMRISYAVFCLNKKLSNSAQST